MFRFLEQIFARKQESLSDAVKEPILKWLSHSHGKSSSSDREFSERLSRLLEMIKLSSEMSVALFPQCKFFLF